jgi:ankyrin repeat protein
MEGKTPLHCAASACYEKDENRHQSEIAEMLISKGAPIDVRDVHGDTPLICAARHANYKIVELLFSKGVDINEKGNIGNIPLHWASTDEWPDEMADCQDQQTKNRKTRLFLLSHGADVNAKNDLGETPLHFAVQGGSASLEYVKLLISKGAEVNAMTSRGVTPLDLVKNDTGKKKAIADFLRMHGARE